MTDLLTGALPDTTAQRERDKSDCPFCPSGSEHQDSVLVQRLVPWRMNQRSQPSCVGHAFAAGINGAIAHANGISSKNTAKPPAGATWCSGVSIWREARRLQGRIEATDRGTRLSYACNGLMMRGWDDYELDEETRPDEANQQDDMRDEMMADDHRSVTKSRIWQTGAERLELVRAALADPRNAVVGAWHLSKPFRAARFSNENRDTILGVESFGGDDGNHALRIFAAQLMNGRWRYALQNSWPYWAGMHTASGKWLAGCAWVDERVIAESRYCHDLMVIRATL